MKRLLLAFSSILLSAVAVYAQSEGMPMPTPMPIPLRTPHGLGEGILLTVIYGAVGMVMACVAYKVADLITPGNLGTEITEQKNISLALLAGAFVLGVCIIIAAAVVG